MWDGQPEGITAVKHQIALSPPDAPPKHSAPYRAGSKQLEFEREKATQMENAGVADAAVTEGASPIVFAPKKDEFFYFGVNYRRLNDVTVLVCYPIPRMDECIDSFGRAKLFSTLHASSGYCPIKMDNEDVDKAVFVAHNGLYKNTMLPSGLKNAPALF